MHWCTWKLSYVLLSILSEDRFTWKSALPSYQCFIRTFCEQLVYRTVGKGEEMGRHLLCCLSRDVLFIPILVFLLLQGTEFCVTICPFLVCNQSLSLPLPKFI